LPWLGLGGGAALLISDALLEPEAPITALVGPAFLGVRGRL
jgi:hypothetical protein